MSERRLRPGRRLLQSRRIARYQPIRFAGAVDDYNPLHIDRELARSMGFEDLPLQMEALAAFVEDLLLEHLQPDEALITLDLRFTNPAVQGQLLEIDISIAQRVEDNLLGKVTIRDQLTRQAVAEGELVVRSRDQGATAGSEPHPTT
jgi:acyl dehydratase